MRIDTLLVADIGAVKDKHVLESRPDDKWPPPGAPSKCGLWAVANCRVAVVVRQKGSPYALPQ